MGAFADWQPRYAERGIATFPVRIDATGKRPQVKGYLKLGSDQSRQLAMRFPEAEAIGFALGARSRLTVLDIDSPDERILADALSRHGSTPVIIRSGSGHFQAWYRHAGERRQIRPSSVRPIDILGSGFVVAPPSQGTRAPYSFLQGGLDDLASLPVMRNVPEVSVKPAALKAEPRASGERNNTLGRACMMGARGCDTVADLIDFAQTRNAEFDLPLHEREVEKVARSAWRYEDNGMNFVNDRFVVPIVPIKYAEIDELMQVSPDAFALLIVLRRNNWDRDQFVVANAMCETMPGGRWTRQRLAAARQVLEKRGKIVLTKAAGRRVGPAGYAWPKGCRESDTNTTPSPRSPAPQVRLRGAA